MMSRPCAVLCLLVGLPALADRPAREAPCRGDPSLATNFPLGTLLWGTERKVPQQEMSSVLSSVALGRARRGDTVLKDLRLEEGRLVAPSEPQEWEGMMLQGVDSAGQPVEVAVCDVKPSPEDPSLTGYWIQVWNPARESWVNPCVPLEEGERPRALAVPGVWGPSGAKRTVKGRFTFACPHGAIAQCVSWGYVPWARKGGKPLEPLHQACTRMARADYCGNGKSHTKNDTLIDMYDGLQVLTRTTESSGLWDPERASFEAAWSGEGAVCLARTRDGCALEEVLAECPGRFERVEQDLGGGDRCKLVRKGQRAEAAPLRNRSYEEGQP